ncbi:MAG: hypothetical protein HRU32_13225 [Rhodobacteraceae bacterium]|nr:hypothetical protein [Paracoccaceae bacterium]
MCLNQFHDILTGTAIREVFEDAAVDYDMIDVEIAAATAFVPDGDSIVANTASQTIAPVIDGPDGPIQLAPIRPYEAVELVAAPPEPGLTIKRDGAVAILENALLRVEVNAAGQLSRVYDKKEARDVLDDGACGNRLQLFEDRPLVWDAWDIDPFFEDRLEELDGPAEIEIVEDTPVRVSLRVSRGFKSSTITQEIRLTSASKRVDFVTHVNWHETHTLLKVAFPVDVHAPRATYDIQWGSIERPTHRNTSWDAARFEVCGQRWADLSDGGYGVALLSDCKYGYDIRDNMMRMSLIKSATMPDVEADQGEHVFTYALLPHAGCWRGAVEQEAAALNHPVRLTGGSPVAPLVGCDHANIVLETLKPRDAGGGWVARFYEAHRKKGNVTLAFAEDVGAVHLCDLEENILETLELKHGEATLTVTPFQIVSLLMEPHLDGG